MFTCPGTFYLFDQIQVGDSRAHQWGEKRLLLEEDWQIYGSGPIRYGIQQGQLQILFQIAGQFIFCGILYSSHSAINSIFFHFMNIISVIKQVRICLCFLQSLCQQMYHYTHLHSLQETVNHIEHKHINGFQGYLSDVFFLAAFHDA